MQDDTKQLPIEVLIRQAKERARKEYKQMEKDRDKQWEQATRKIPDHATKWDKWVAESHKTTEHPRDYEHEPIERPCPMIQDISGPAMWSSFMKETPEQTLEWEIRHIKSTFLYHTQTATEQQIKQLQIYCAKRFPEAYAHVTKMIDLGAICKCARRLDETRAKHLPRPFDAEIKEIVTRARVELDVLRSSEHCPKVAIAPKAEVDMAHAELNALEENRPNKTVDEQIEAILEKALAELDRLRGPIPDTAFEIKLANARAKLGLPRSVQTVQNMPVVARSQVKPHTQQLFRRHAPDMFGKMHLCCRDRQQKWLSQKL